MLLIKTERTQEISLFKFLNYDNLCFSKVVNQVPLIILVNALRILDIWM